METKESERGSNSNVIVLGLGANRSISQEDLMEERILTHDADAAIRARDQKREWIRQCLATGGKVEPGPLKAELRERLNRRESVRRQRDEKSYTVLSVYV